MGAPELIVEVAASSVSLDTNEKLDTYRRAGVNEYVVWRTQDGEVDAWQLHNEEYVPWAENEGVLRSTAFPGLWLNVRALIVEDAAALIATLNQGIASPEHCDFVRRLQSMQQSLPSA